MRLKAGTWEVDSSLRSPEDEFSERLGEPDHAFESRWIWEKERLMVFTHIGLSYRSKMDHSS